MRDATTGVQLWPRKWVGKFSPANLWKLKKSVLNLEKKPWLYLSMLEISQTRKLMKNFLNVSVQEKWKTSIFEITKFS